MNEHERVQDLAVEYALDILDPAEAKEVEEHLAGCLACRRVYREARAVGGALALAAPPVVAPPELRARILAGATRRPQPVVSRRQWGGWAIGVAAAAAIVALGIDDARQRQGRAATQSQLAVQRDIAQAVLAGQQYVRLAPVSGNGPSAIWVNPAGQAPYLAAPTLPALQPGRTYELWFLQGNKASPAGTFESGAMLTVPALPKGTTGLAVTVEPRGGSLAPTSAPILVGTV